MGSTIDSSGRSIGWCAKFTKQEGDRLSDAVERLLEVKCDGAVPDDWDLRDVAEVLLDLFTRST